MANDPVPIQYKSGTHAVFSLGSISTSHRSCLPQLSTDMLSYSAVWDTNIFTQMTPINAEQNIINQIPEDQAAFYLVDIVRDNNEQDTFNSAEEWYIAGEAIELTNDIELNYTEGDHFYQRYDCLKTYQYDDSSKNNIVEILSFMCETRVNLDGRYDIHKGNYPDNTYMNPNNFNRINTVYSQENNYFTQYEINHLGAEVNDYPAAIMWSKTKTNGEEVDSYLQFPASSILQLDGQYGPVRALRLFNNELYAFQDKAIAQILYNNRVQIPTSDGLPIEITNSAKVSGYRYITVNSGCYNKWSITQSKQGLYYIDSIQSAINLFSGQGINDLADTKGMRSWINNDNPGLTPWSIDEKGNGQGNYRMFYDQTLDDLFIISYNDNEIGSSPYYSAITDSFNSFVAYDQTPFMFNLNDKFYAIKEGRLWELNSEEVGYNDIYNIDRVLDISFISNDNEPYDKVFDWIDYRSDSFDNTDQRVCQNYDTFNQIIVDNEYQHAEAILKPSKFGVNNIQKKFRNWRVTLPRDNFNRIRNTWCKIKLVKNINTQNYFKFYDVTVNYSI